MEAVVKLDLAKLVAERNLRRSQKSLQDQERLHAPKLALDIARYNVARHVAELRKLELRKPA